MNVRAQSKFMNQTLGFPCIPALLSLCPSPEAPRCAPETEGEQILAHRGRAGGPCLHTCVRNRYVQVQVCMQYIPTCVCAVRIQSHIRACSNAIRMLCMHTPTVCMRAAHACTPSEGAPLFPRVSVCVRSPLSACERARDLARSREGEGPGRGSSERATAFAAPPCFAVPVSVRRTD